KLAANARCHRDTAHKAIKALRKANLLRWVHQFKRGTIDGVANRLRRTASAYTFCLTLPVIAEQQRTDFTESRTGTEKERKKGASQVISSALPCHTRHAPTPREVERFNAVLTGFLALRPGGG